MKKRFGRLVAALLVALFAFTLAACQASTPAPTSTATAVIVPTETAPAPAVSTPAVSIEVAATVPPFILEGATTTDSGLQYLEIAAGDGAAPKAGEIVTIQYIASLPNGTELANTYTEGQPFSTVWGRAHLLPGWEEGIGLMKVNGKAKIVLPPELAFGAEGAGKIPPNSQILIVMELLSVESAPLPTDVAEKDLIKTDSGLQYYDITPGDGAESAKNSSVSTDYKIWVKTDTGYDYIDSSEGGKPVDFVLGRGDMVFPGWEEGATGMKVGGKRLLVIPAELGLGAQGQGLIPPNAVLVMEIQLMNLSDPRKATKVDDKDYTVTESGLKYYDLIPGTGDMPAKGQTVIVHYTGWLEDGTQFDSSLDRGEPFSFQLGTGGVIAGWDEGVATMKVGSKRQLVVPADLGYGDAGAGGVIPPGATLIFEVELLSIQP